MNAKELIETLKAATSHVVLTGPVSVSVSSDLIDDARRTIEVFRDKIKELGGELYQMQARLKDMTEDASLPYGGTDEHPEGYEGPCG